MTDKNAAKADLEVRVQGLPSPRELIGEIVDQEIQGQLRRELPADVDGKQQYST